MSQVLYQQAAIPVTLHDMNPPPFLYPLHLFEGGGGRYGGRSFLDDLLVPPLDGAVAAEHGDGVAVLVGQDLDLQVAGVLRQLHDEDGRAGHLCLDLGRREGRSG